MNFHTCTSEKNLAEEALAVVLKALEEAIEKHGHARVGLAGGSTPKALYKLLGTKPLPWNKITWILIDERYVSDEDEESNVRMITETLWTSDEIQSGNKIHFDTSLTPTESAFRMGEKVKELRALREPLFDLLILGAGSDGHIASLFEQDPALLTSEPAYMATAPKTYKTEMRLTLSLHSLTSAESALLLLKGPEKRAVLLALEPNASDNPKLPKATALKFLAKKVPLHVLGYFEN